MGMIIVLQMRVWIRSLNGKDMYEYVTFLVESFRRQDIHK